MTAARLLTTEEFAAALNVRPKTVLKNHSTCSHYMGVKPIKMPNRRLLWPEAGLVELRGGLAAPVRTYEEGFEAGLAAGRREAEALHAKNAALIEALREASTWLAALARHSEAMQKALSVNK